MIFMSNAIYKYSKIKNAIEKLLNNSHVHYGLTYIYYIKPLSYSCIYKFLIVQF